MEESTNNMNMGGQPEPTMVPQSEGSLGPVIGTIIILAVIVLGGLYFWGQRVNNNVMTDTQVQDTVQTIKDQSTSDTPADIQADLQATDIDNIDSQLNGQ